VAPETPVRAASTVVVLRDGTRGPEVFMVRRHQAIAFMAGAHVFPGGRVDPDDREADDRWCDGLDAARSRIPDAGPDASVAFHVAATRELFEEAGVLLARTAAGEFLSLTNQEEHERFTAHRFDVNAGRRTFSDVVRGERLRLALDVLVHFAHWVTPSIDIKRFDTRFFVTRVPPEQVPVHDNHEATDSTWVRPAAAIHGVASGAFMLPPPTWATLRELEHFATVDAALSWAATRPVHRREPRVIEEGDRRRIILPGDPSMPEPAPVPFETRFLLVNGHWTAENTE
jgi:8-oxo-dGTP pyrophosphatase MutT (NUDIX family)